MAAEDKSVTSPEEGGKRMTIGQHLDELRRRLFRASIAVLLVFAGSWFFRDELMEVLLQPHYDAVASLQRNLDQKFRDGLIPQREVVDPRPIVTSYTETIVTYMKACFIVSLFLAGPYVLWQIWGFIAAGLYRREKSFIHRYFPFALVLFFAGIAFGNFLLIPIGLDFLANFGSERVRQAVRISDYLSLFLTLSVALGLVFQIPMAMVILSRLGIVVPSAYRGKWKFVLVGCFVVSAFATPTPDPYNQSLLALSMYLLYEIGILFARIAYRERQRIVEGASS